MLLHLQGLGRAVGTELRVTELLTPYVNEMMAKRFDPRRLAHQAARAARSWERLVAESQDAQAILAQLRAAASVDFRVHDADERVDQLVDGLIAAASILASAQLVSRRTAPTIGGVSLPG